MEIDVERRRNLSREGALVHPRPDLGTLTVTGEERQSWLNGMLTCDLAPLGPGGAAYGLSVVKTGKILAEVWVLLADDRIVMAVRRDRVVLLKEHLERFLVMEDVELEDASDAFGWLFAHGPLAAELVPVTRARGALAGSVDWTGLGGAVAVVAEREVSLIEETWLAQLGDRGGPLAEQDYPALCVEAQIPRFGVDFDEQNYPQEASLETRAVSFQKGCYLGQETVFMLEKRGHAKKKVVRIAVEGGGEVAPGTAVTSPEGAAVGTVSSSAPAPEGDGWLALGQVKFKHTAPGTELGVDGRPARVSPPAHAAGG